MTPDKLNKVLCINDSDITLFILKRTLSKSNFSEKIVEKSNGQEALNYCFGIIHNSEDLETIYPRVIFLDLHMPVMNGWEFLEKFAQEIWPLFRETKIVITSQSVDSDDSLRAKAYPFIVDFLNVPITSGYLVQLHQQLLRGYSIQN
ncbi:MAG: response regulator [Daejeonella sp.]